MKPRDGKESTKPSRGFALETQRALEGLFKLSDIADYLGVQSSRCRDFTLSLGIDPRRMKTGAREAIVVSEAEARIIITQYRRRRGKGVFLKNTREERARRSLGISTEPAPAEPESLRLARASARASWKPPNS